MTVDEIEHWLVDQPFLFIYLGLLLVGSLVSFIILARRIMKMNRLGPNPVPPWSIGGVDFGLFLVSLILWFLLSGRILFELYSWIAGKETEPGAGFMVIGGLVLQAGMYYLFFRFRFHFRNLGEGSMSPSILSTRQGLLLGLFYFLACLPVIYGVGVLWNSCLEWLRECGWNIDLPLQDAVLLFQSTENPLAVSGLILLAVVVAPIVEETVFRGGIYRFFKGKTRISFSLIISGLLFGLVHGNLQSLPGLVTVGMCLGMSYELSGSLKVPIFFHAFFNLNSIIWILLIPDGMVG